jgi:hypothetical protein
VVLNLPGKVIQRAPAVYVSNDPAELLLIDGEPNYVPVPGTKLLWVSNTESDLFRLGADGPIYYLVAGRWFTAQTSTAARGSSRRLVCRKTSKRSRSNILESRVLASVPGTQQGSRGSTARAGTANCAREQERSQSPEVAYQGEPKYEPIEGTNLQRAVNTDKEIILAGTTYYMCYQGVWFMANLPNGPWSLATEVPPEVYKIPASSPAHSVTYVTVENSTDEYVTYAAVAGYTGMMIGWGCAVWGTGWYYPPYYWYGGYYPIYYPYWRTYGYGSWYNPYTGVYGTAGRIYGPYGGAGFGARYNPSTGTYARGAFAYGPNGARACCASLQSAHRELCADASGQRRLRQLGIDAGEAR